jgi:hypothetical protein
MAGNLAIARHRPKWSELPSLGAGCLFERQPASWGLRSRAEQHPHSQRPHRTPHPGSEANLDYGVGMAVCLPSMGLAAGRRSGHPRLRPGRSVRWRALVRPPARWPIPGSRHRPVPLPRHGIEGLRSGGRPPAPGFQRSCGHRQIGGYGRGVDRSSDRARAKGPLVRGAAANALGAPSRQGSRGAPSGHWPVAHRPGGWPLRGSVPGWRNGSVPPGCVVGTRQRGVWA